MAAASTRRIDTGVARTGQSPRRSCSPPDRKPSPNCCPAAVQVLGDNPDYQQQLREYPDGIPTFIEEALRMHAPDEGRFPSGPAHHRTRQVHLPAGTIVMLCLGAANRDPRNSRTRTNSGRTAKTFASTSRSAAASTPAPVHRWRVSRARSHPCVGCWTGWAKSASTRAFTDQPHSVITPTSRRFTARPDRTAHRVRPGALVRTTRLSSTPKGCPHMAFQAVLDELRQRPGTGRDDPDHRPATEGGRRVHRRQRAADGR